MRYFYCDDKVRATGRGKKGNKDNKKVVNIKKSKRNSNSNSGLLSSSSSLNNKSTPRIRLLARHLYNNSVIELVVHLM